MESNDRLISHVAQRFDIEREHSEKSSLRLSSRVLRKSSFVLYLGEAVDRYIRETRLNGCAGFLNGILGGMLSRQRAMLLQYDAFLQRVQGSVFFCGYCSFQANYFLLSSYVT